MRRKTVRIRDGRISFAPTPASFSAVGVLTVRSEGESSILIMTDNELDAVIDLLAQAKTEREKVQENLPDPML